MIFFWVFGDDVEEAMGPVRFIGFYLRSGILAGLAFVAFTPHSQQKRDDAFRWLNRWLT